MSVTIKPNKMKYKNSSGNYVGINAIAEQTTAEEIADIQAASTAAQGEITNLTNTKKTEITNKGNETLASIPQDYTSLSNQVNSLSSAVINQNLKGGINLLGVDQLKYRIGYALYTNGDVVDSPSRILSEYFYAKAGSIFDVDSGYKFSLARYSPVDGSFISPIIETRTEKYILDQDCLIRFSIADVSGTTVQDDHNKDHMKTLIFSDSSYDYRSLSNFIKSGNLLSKYGGTELLSIADLAYTSGTINIYGEYAQSDTRIISEYFYAKSGSIFSVDEGYKFLLCRYTKSADGTYTAILPIIHSREIDYVLDQDCFVRLIIADINDTAQLDYSLRNHMHAFVFGIREKDERHINVSMTEGSIYSDANSEHYGDDTDFYSITGLNSRMRTSCFIELIDVQYLFFNVNNANTDSAKTYRVFKYDKDFHVLGYEDVSNTGLYMSANGQTKYIKIVYFNASDYISHNETLTITYCGGEIIEVKNPYRQAIYENGVTRKYVSIKDGHFTGMLFKLPPNYSNKSEKIPLIIFCQGSDDFRNYADTAMTGSYNSYYNYLRDNGFCVVSINGFGDYYGYSTSLFGIPYNMKCFRYGLEKLITEYNIDPDRVVVCSKSGGGYVASLLPYMSFINIKCVGMLAPGLNLFEHVNIYQQRVRTVLAQDFGFDTDVEWFTGNDFNRTDERYLLFLKSNLHLTCGYDGYNSHLIGKSLEQKATDIYNGTFDTSISRTIKCPVKIWCAMDDQNVSYTLVNAYISQLQNAGCNAQMRTMPNNTGGHHAVDTDVNALQTENVVTRLGITYASVPTAYYEMMQFILENI